MAKLRKMLGDANDPLAVSLRERIETQSKETLIRWAVGYVTEHYKPILQAADAWDVRLEKAVAANRDYLEGHLTQKEAKAFLGAAAEAARGWEGDPAAQAAAKAVAVACSVMRTPTNALGFCFYGAAAYAYQAAGTSESSDRYEELARSEFERLLASLEAISVEGEENPVRVNWNC
jgi:hypothetical protein